MSLSLLQYIIISYLLLLPVSLNIFIWRSNIVSFIFGGVFFVFQSIILSKHLFPKKRLSAKIPLGFFFFSLILSITGSIIYYIGDFSPAGISISLLLLPIIMSFILFRSKHLVQKRFDFEITSYIPKINSRSGSLLLTYLILVGTNIWILLDARTTEAITTPFSEINIVFWSIFVVSTIILLLLTRSVRLTWLSQTLWTLHLFMSFSLVISIYQLGFGFDQFIHQKVEEILVSDGIVQPKTPYYIGMYSLTVLFHWLLGLPTQLTNTLLVPLVSSLYLPLFWYELRGLSKGSFRFEHGLAEWLPILSIIIPFTSFTFTTPQHLANLLFLLILIISLVFVLNDPNDWKLSYLWLMAISASFIHPLTGIPALIFVLVLTFHCTHQGLKIPKSLKRIIWLQILIFSSISMPLLFIFQAYLQGNISSRISDIAKITTSFSEWWPFTFSQTGPARSTFFEFGYFIQEQFIGFFILISIIIVLWAIITRKIEHLSVYLTSFLILFMNSILVGVFLAFPELIQYESHDFSLRLLNLALWCLVPLASIGLLWITKARFQRSQVFIWVLIVMLTWGATGAVFASYPRDNRFEFGRQYSTSQTDLDTILKIEEISGQRPYIVLANQQVSVGAINIHGFSPNITDSQENLQYFYPIPTSSPLYQNYLSMVNKKPTRSEAQAVANEYNIDLIFFVLNDYWDRSSQLAEQAKLEASNWTKINEKNYIFTYDFSDSNSLKRFTKDSQ